MIESSFHLTYEELKQSTSPLNSSSSLASFHLTYEELKHKLCLFSTPLSNIVFILPMRNWNIARMPQNGEEPEFSSYLWGIETVEQHFPYIPGKTVFILPMRNWNRRNCLVCYGVGYVFILPMRNWNRSRTENRSYHAEFSSYLWGIETRKTCLVNMLIAKSFHLTYEELKHKRRLIS